MRQSIFPTIILLALFAGSLKGAAPPLLKAATREANAAVEKRLHAMLRTHGIIRHPAWPFELYIKRLQGRKMIHVIVKRKRVDGSVDLVANAAGESELRVDVGKKRLLLHMSKGAAWTADGSMTYFESR